MIILISEVGQIEVDFEPNDYATKSGAARALHKALTNLEVAIGGCASEVILQTPEQSEEYGTGKNWRVIWEGGFYEWALGVDISNSKAGWYAEPHYSFDLCFTD